MKRYVTVLLLFVTSYLQTTEVNSQQICATTNQGNHFIVVFPDNFGNYLNDDRMLRVMIVSLEDKTTKVNITSPHRLSDNSHFNKTILIQPKSYERIIVPIELEIQGTERNFKTIEINSDYKVSIDVLHLKPTSTEGYLAIPTDILGTQHVVTSFEGLNSSLPGLFVIYGSNNDTTVYIQPKANITYDNTEYTSGDTLELKLSRLEAIQITSIGDLTGTIVTSDKPIGVISGHSCHENPTKGCDFLIEQMLPVHNWGTRHFYSARTSSDTRNYRMLAFFNETSFTVDDTVIQLDSGEFHAFTLIGNGMISSNKPASLVQIIRQMNGLSVDPSIIQVPSLNQFLPMLSFAVPDISTVASSNLFKSFVNIIIRANAIDDLRLNGMELSTTSSSSLPYIAYEDVIQGIGYDVIVVRLPRVEGFYSITQESAQPSPMSAIVYGYTNSESYGYPAGFASPVPTPTLLSSINSFNISTCLADISLTWTIPITNIAIDRYSIYLDESLLATSSYNNYSYFTKLEVDTKELMYTLIASSCAGESTESEPSIISNTGVPPPTPDLQSSIIDLNAFTCSANISLTWTTPSASRNINGYFLYLNGSLLATTTSNSYIHSTVLNLDTNYQYTLIVSSCPGNSTESEPSIINSTGVPPPTPNLQSSIIDLNAFTCSANISLTWTTSNASRNINGYFLYLNGSLLATTTSDSYIHSTVLNLDTNYQYTLIASSCAGNSTESEPSIINNTAVRFPTPSLESSIIDINAFTYSANISLTWTTFDIIDENFLYHNGSLLAITTSDSYIHSNILNPNTNYQYTVIGSNCIGNSSESEPSIINITESSPNIISPPTNITKTITNASEDIPMIECVSTGDPATDIFWTRDFSTRFINSPNLEIEFVDIIANGGNVFYCVAGNRAGRDVISVTYEIVLTSESIQQTIHDILRMVETAPSISDEESRVNADITSLLINSTNNIMVGNQSIILEDAANIVQLTVNKTNGTFSEGTTERISKLLSSVVKGSLQLEELTVRPQEQTQTETIVATIPTSLALSISALESFSRRLSTELETSNINSTVRTIESEMITIVVQNILLNENYQSSGETTSHIELPQSGSDSEEFTASIKLSYKIAANLSTDGISLKIATSIINGIQIKDSDLNETTQMSDILTIAIAGRSGTVALAENTALTFDVASKEQSESVCAFLEGVNWVSEGLQTVQNSSNLTKCISPHLTSFAVFVRPIMDSKPPIGLLAIRVVGYLTVIISFIFLIISLILFIVAWKPFFKVEINIVYFNYCISMLLATGVFIFAIEAGTYNVLLCRFISFLLHYTWLAVFTWTLCLSILIMHKLGVFSAQKIYWYLIIFGWTFPIIISVFTIVITRDYYIDNSGHCFLNVDYGVLWALIVPNLAMLIINVIFLIIAIIQFIQSNKANQNNEERKVLRNAIITGLILTLVLGLPWLFLVFYMAFRQDAIKWCFIITKGLVGIIFSLVVVPMNKEVWAILRRNKLTCSNTQDEERPSAKVIVNQLTSKQLEDQNTLERQMDKKSEIKNADIELDEVKVTSNNNADNIHEVEIGATKEESTEHSDNIYETSDDLPVGRNLD